MSQLSALTVLCVKRHAWSAQSKLDVAELEDTVQEHLIHCNLLWTFSSQDQIGAYLT